MLLHTICIVKKIAGTTCALTKMTMILRSDWHCSFAVFFSLQELQWWVPDNENIHGANQWSQHQDLWRCKHYCSNQVVRTPGFENVIRASTAHKKKSTNSSIWHLSVSCAKNRQHKGINGTYRSTEGPAFTVICCWAYYGQSHGLEKWLLGVH